MTTNKDTAVTQYDRCAKYDRAVAESARVSMVSAVDITCGAGTRHQGGVDVSLICCSGSTSLGL